MTLTNCLRPQSTSCVYNDDSGWPCWGAQSSLLADLEMDESSAARLIKMQCIHKTVSVDGVEGGKTTSSREQGK